MSEEIHITYQDFSLLITSTVVYWFEWHVYVILNHLLFVLLHIISNEIINNGQKFVL